MRRLVASVILLALMQSLAAPPHAPAGACPEKDGTSGPPTLVAAMDHGACAHPGAGPCLAAIGCLGAPQALRPAGTVVESRLTAVLIRPVAVPQYADLFRTGPPTPPPNAI